jgi:hypothetical protein
MHESNFIKQRHLERLLKIPLPLHRFLAYKDLVIHLPLILLTKDPGVVLLQVKQTLRAARLGPRTTQRRMNVK